MKVLPKTVPSPKKKNKFPTILLRSQKLRKKKEDKNNLKKRKQLFNKKRLTCEKCNGKFATWWEIREHWLSSGHKTPEPCRWCRKKTFALQSHLCKEHWNVACMCKYCGELFMFRERLEEHEQCHSKLEYRCYLCGKRRKTEDLLRQHIYQHYVYERYGCNVCEKRFKKKKNVEKHLKYVHFICQYCGNTCEDKEGLKEHWKIHEDLKCVLCYKVFSQKNRLKYHYQMKHGHQDFYKCTLCFQRFPVKSRLLEHLKLKHKGYAKFSCETCEKPFLYWSKYLRHFQDVHVTPQNNFSCSFCNFSTNKKLKLQWHVEKTSGDGFFCKVCKVHLVCKTKFDEHMRKHVGERVYECDYCDRKYATPDVLKHHVSISHQAVVIAENNRGHPCLVPQCHKYYASKNSLSRHMRRNHSDVGSSILAGYFCAENTITCRLPLIEEKRSLNMDVVSISSQSCVDEPSEPTNRAEKIAKKEICDVGTDINSSSIRARSDKPVEKRGFEDEADINDNLSLVWSQAEKPSEKIGLQEKVDVWDSVSVRGASKKIIHHKYESDINEVDVYYCDLCNKFWFANGNQFRKHMTRHNKQVWDDDCAECEELLESPEDAVRHYVQDHLKVQYIS